MIRILVDSSSDYQIEELIQKNITFVPISITIGGKSYADGIELDRNDLYRILEDTGEFPKTSQPSPQDFLSIFQDVKDSGDEIVCLLLSSELSGTYQSAVLAKDMADYDKIYLIDTLSATYNIKIMADYACRLRSEGVCAAEIAEKIEALKSRVKVVAALDTLEYLSRGGRISKTVAAIGDMANLKPIITLTPDGKVGMIGKCLGKNKAICYIKKHLQELTLDENFPVYAIYSYGTDNCEIFEDKMIQEGFTIDDRLQIGATIGAHIGPEAFGIIFVTKD